MLQAGVGGLPDTVATWMQTGQGFVGLDVSCRCWAGNVNEERLEFSGEREEREKMCRGIYAT